MQGSGAGGEKARSEGLCSGSVPGCNEVSRSRGWSPQGIGACEELTGDPWPSAPPLGSGLSVANSPKAAWEGKRGRAVGADCTAPRQQL